MKKIFVIGIALLALVSCNMDFYPSDSMTSSQLKENPSAAVYTTDGIYSLFISNQPYKGSSDGGNMYIRHLFQLTESRGDNISISGHSTDPFLGPYRYEDVDNTKNKYYFWWMGYKMIYAANSNIDGLKDSYSGNKLSAHLLGENYFFRAYIHFNLVSLFAMPYVCGRDNPGIPNRRSMDYSQTTRATVGEVYDGIVEDLKDAIKYMDMGSPRGDASYVSATAARAMLSRVYLNMGDEHLEECVTLCNELIAKAPSKVKGEYTLDQLEKYPEKTWDYDETIWCIHHIYPTDVPSTEATIGSMYFTTDEGNNGWGQWYWNDELIELFNRYPEDKRFLAYFHYDPKAYDPETDNGKVMVCWPTKALDENDFRVTDYVKGVTPSNGDYIVTTTDGKTYTAKRERVNGYTRYFIERDLTGDPTYFGGKTPVYIRKDVDEDLGIRSSQYVRYYNSKFSGQDGQVTVSSPVMIRWGEVFLNRAEALARLDRDEEAFADVNLIRHRAGVKGDADFTTANYRSRGYESSLDVVLDERRMELCFEGDRMFSIFRNKKKLDRRYVGYHPWEVIDYNDPRIALLIPADEINATDIEQNNQKK
ncbi:MAG: RagB/SusD family nutrient uptake outer membrane protein [Bacteroidales bacterium]|nr:RagB/SusD family nutrient uptake outer membrane protein [Bacteroidales bacterium]